VAEIREHQEQWSAAADAYARAQALNARAPLARRRAVALLSAGRAAEARDVVQSALGSGRSEAKEPILLYLLAESQRVLKDLDGAHATVQKLLAANPADVRGLHVLSMILQDRGDIKGAERTLRDLIARDPLDANALNSLGYMYAERGERLDEAVELVQRALKVEPGNASYLDSLGWAYLQQGRIDLADGPLTEAAAKLQQSSVVQDHLGDLRYKQQRYRDAAAAWERALAGDGQTIDRARIEKKIREARGRM
jgi:tetratricopeptide (TPR) repeat protein